MTVYNFLIVEIMYQLLLSLGSLAVALGMQQLLLLFVIQYKWQGILEDRLTSLCCLFTKFQVEGCSRHCLHMHCNVMTSMQALV